MKSMQKLCCVTLGMLFSAMASAQSARPAPGDPAAKVPPVHYQSAFENYQAFREQEIANWRGANDEVRDAAGHKGHAPGQGSGENAPPKPPAGQPQKAPAAKGHEGHK